MTEETNHYCGKMKAKYNYAIKTAKSKCTLKECFLCQGKEYSSNKRFTPIASHTVPRYILNNMSDYHFYKTSLNFELPQYESHVPGINEAGIFKMLCNKCDTKLFNTYEACEDNLKSDLLIENIVIETTIKSMFKKSYDLWLTINF